MADTAQYVDLRAFEWRAGFEDTSGATTSYGGEGKTFDIKGAMDDAENYGPAGMVIVNAHEFPDLAERLNDFAALKSVAVPEDLAKEAEKQNKAAAKADAANQPDPIGVESIQAQEEHVASLEKKTDASDQSQSTSRRSRSGAES